MTKIDNLDELIETLEEAYFLHCGHMSRFQCPLMKNRYEIIDQLRQYKNDLLNWAVIPIPKEDGWFCPKCQDELTPDMKFCPNCGARINWWLYNSQYMGHGIIGEK